MGPRAGQDGRRKFTPTGIGSPDRPARSKSLYRLSYPRPFTKFNRNNYYLTSNSDFIFSSSFHKHACHILTNALKLSRSVIPVVYIKTTLDQRSGKWQSKNTTIFVGTIIYQLHVSASIGHLQVGIQRQRKISITSIGMGGRDLVYKYMGYVVAWSFVFAWCVHTKRTHACSKTDSTTNPIYL